MSSVSVMWRIVHRCSTYGKTTTVEYIVGTLSDALSAAIEHANKERDNPMHHGIEFDALIHPSKYPVGNKREDRTCTTFTSGMQFDMLVVSPDKTTVSLLITEWDDEYFAEKVVVKKAAKPVKDLILFVLTSCSGHYSGGGGLHLGGHT